MLPNTIPLQPDVPNVPNVPKNVQLEHYKCEVCPCKKKYIPAMPIEVNTNADFKTIYSRKWKCPSCYTERTFAFEYNYCPNCGQRLDWDGYYRLQEGGYDE